MPEFGVLTSSVLNIFFQESDDGKAPEDKRYSGYADFPPSYGDVDVPFVIISNAWSTYLNGFGLPEYMCNLINHEIGHDLGLNHTWIKFDYDGCDDTPDQSEGNCNCYFEGYIPCTPVYCPSPSPDPCNDPADCPCAVLTSCDVPSNNIMDYNVYRSIFSPCQLGKIHYWLVNEPVLNYIEKDYCEIVDEDLVVDAPGEIIVWESKRIMKGNIIITPLTTLVIKCWVGMPTDAKIVVQASGTLKVDGGTITSNCGELWQGIEVWGAGSSYPHPAVSSVYSGTYPTSATTHHGVVYIKDGSTIELARNGITTSKYDDFGNASYRGGIIVAHGAEFINCKRSSEFMQYDYSPAQTDDDNISEFYRCNFEVNDDYPCSETFNAHITMWDIDGVDIIGCTFKDLRNVCTNAGEGIYSIDATYTVASDLCGGAIPCDEHISTFTNLVRAIHAENANSRPRDILISDVLFKNNYRGILFSNVNNSLVMNNTFEIQDQLSLNCYGIYLEDCKNYQVENNSFTTDGTYDGSSPYNGGIYVVNNSDYVTEIYRNYFADLEAGIRVQTENTKLQLRCNTFDSPIGKHDIYVTNTGQLGHQGLCLTGGLYTDLDKALAMANNVFTHDCNNAEGDLKIFSGHPELKYRHHPTTLMTPSCYTTGATYVTLNSCTNTTSDGCPSELPSGGSGYRLSGDNEEQTGYELMVQVSNLNEAIESLEGLLAKQAEDYFLEYNMELEKEENDDLVYLIDEKNRILARAVNTYYLENKIDSAIIVLENENVEWRLREIVNLQMSNGNYTNAIGTLDLIPTNSQENIDFKILANVLVQIGLESRSIDSLSETEISTLQSIAGKQSPSGVAAENIISFVTGIDYPEVFDLDIEEEELRKLNTMGVIMEIYPNPATDELIVDLKSKDEYSDYSCEIFDISGKKVLSLPLIENAINYINIANLPSGILIIKILDDNIAVSVEKIIHN